MDEHQYIWQHGMDILKIVKLLVPKVKNFNAPMTDGWTPIHLAAAEVHVEIVEFMATKVENPNAPKLLDRWTPIHLAECLMEELLCFCQFEMDTKKL